MENQDNVKKFYDNFGKYQENVGINDRIFGLYNRMLKLGLNANSNVLELGCGVGTMTFMLQKIVKNGKIEAVDISPKCVEDMKKTLTSSNIMGVAHDVVDYSPVMQKPDFITLFDVIEHVPLSSHPQLFENLSRIMGDSTSLLINIPSPAHIKFLKEKQPEKLQVIDQEVYLLPILEALQKNNLQLQQFETYSVWDKNDYQFMVITKPISFNRNPVKKGIFQKIYFKVLKSLFYNYKVLN